MLSLLILIPILSAFMIVFQDNESRMKKLALQASLLNFLLSVYMWIQFDSSVTHYQFIFDFKELTYLDFNIGVDGISIYFVLLTTFLTPIALLSNYNNITFVRFNNFWIFWKKNRGYRVSFNNLLMCCINNYYLYTIIY